MAKLDIKLDVDYVEVELENLTNIKEQILTLADGREPAGVGLEYIRCGERTHAKLTIQFIDTDHKPANRQEKLSALQETAFSGEIKP